MYFVEYWCVISAPHSIVFIGSPKQSESRKNGGNKEARPPVVWWEKENFSHNFVKAHGREGGVFLTHYEVNTVWQEIDIHGWYWLVNISFRPVCMCKNTNSIWLVAGRFPAQRAIFPEFDGIFVISQTKLLNRQSWAGEIWRLNPHVTSPWWCSLFCCVLFCCGL